MAVLKRSLILAPIVYLVFFVDRLTWYTSVHEFFHTGVFYIVPVALVAAGLILGWLFTMIIQHSRWIRSFYLLGLNTIGIAFIILIICLDADPLYIGFYRATHPSGKHVFRDFDGVRGHDIARGYDKFYQLLPANTHLDLLGYLLNNPPVPGEPNDTSWTVYYCYYLLPDSSSARLSTVEFHNGTFRVLANNQPALTDTIYRRLAREYNEEKIGKLKMVKELAAMTKDSTLNSKLVRQSVEKQFRDTFPW